MASSNRPHPEVPRAARPRRTHGARPSHRVPRDLLDPVVDYFRPQRVILFGSRARGDATRDSDIDLLVVVDDDTPEDKLTWRAGYEAHRTDRAADVIAMRAEDFERDRNTVLACLAGDPPLYDSAAFHCQQAVEKLLKGFLTLAGRRGGKTHSLEQLGAPAQASFPDIAELVAAAQGWSKWAWVYRYPEEDAPPQPDEVEIRVALDVIERLFARLRAANPEPPVHPSRRGRADRSSG